MLVSIKFGDFLKDTRISQRKTVKDVANQLNISVSKLNSLEKSENVYPTAIDYIPALNEIFGFNLLKEFIKLEKSIIDEKYENDDTWDDDDEIQIQHTWHIPLDMSIDTDKILHQKIHELILEYAPNKLIHADVK